MPHYNDLCQLPPVNIMDWRAPEKPVDPKALKFFKMFRMADTETLTLAPRKSYIVAESDLDMTVSVRKK